MNSLVLAQIALTALALPPLPADTPPRLPIPVEQLASLQTAQDVIGVTLLADGQRAPAQLVLPELDNRRHTLEYMRVHYPEAARSVKSSGTPVAWVFVAADGKVADAQLLTSSGHAELDSLSLQVLRMAVFKPATHAGKPLGVWVPMPARVPSYEDLIRTIETADRDLSEAPQEVAYTQKPVLLNRNQVEAAIVRIVHQLNPHARAATEAFARAQSIGGMVQLNIFIDTLGAVQNVIIKRSSGNRDLDSNAITIGRMMRFAPARNGETPVESWIEVPIRFKLN